MKRLLVLLAGCGGADVEPARPRAACEGHWDVQSQEDVDAVAGCGRVGSIAIRTAAALDLAPLGAIDVVTGDLVVGPTFDLSTIHVGVREVGGALRLVSNGMATGAFLPRLERAGAVEIAGNVSLASVSAPALREVAGDLVIADNPALEYVDLAALTHVGGTRRVDMPGPVTDIPAP